LECIAGFDAGTAQVCAISAGAMTIHHGCTIHGAAVNKSDTNRLGYILNYKVPPEAHPELGEFAWNAGVAASVHQQHRRWLRRGGIFAEIARFLRSDSENRRYFIERLLKRTGL
jgi:hypothetical protein